MAVKVKDGAAAAQKFASRAAAASGDYAKGLQGSGPTWQAHTAAAGQAWQDGVNNAITNGRFVKGVNSSGGANFEAAATSKGAQRYGPGVQSAAPKWQANTQPYLDAISSANLPQRYAKGDPRNMQRAQVIVDTLHKKKMGS